MNNDWLSSTLINGANNAPTDEIEQNKQLSISDLVAQTASQVVQQQHTDQFASLGFHWVDEWAVFYNASTGYFYDPNSELFFHPSTQLYYKYNADTGQYDQIWHGDGGQTQMPAVKWSKKAFLRRASRIFGDDFVQKARQEDVDLAELTLDLVDRCSFLAGDYCDKRLIKRALFADATAMDEEELGEGVSIKRPAALPPAGGVAFSDSAEEHESDSDGGSSSSSNERRLTDEIARRQQEEEIARNAPCIRLVERPRGRLHIVTICGARVGFGHSMDVQIGAEPNIGIGDVSPSSGGELFSIRYSSDEGHYWMEWHSCTVCAEKDGHCLQPGVSHSVQHEDVIIIGNGPAADGGISLSFHIHNGLNTCQGCEPGLLSDNTTTAQSDGEERPKKRLSRFAEHRRQVRALKEQYGLLEEEDINATAELRQKYVDRAGRRRRQFGSDLPMPSPTVLNSAGGIYAHCVATPQTGCSSDSVQLQQQFKGDGFASSSAAAVAVPINAENKGFKLLKGMGWTEGQGLGKHSQGIRGPISTQFKNDRVGLGTSSTSTTTAASSSKISIHLLSKQQQNVVQMQKRIAQIEARQIADSATEGIIK